MSNASQKYLAIYSGVLTVAFGAIVLTGATSTRSEKFDVIDVQRINVREPDGTLRMTISNKAQFPGLIIKGEEIPHERGAAGVIFLNDEGTENGGLMFAGQRKANGEARSFGHLSFDPYHRDQTLVLAQTEKDGAVRAGLRINDTGDVPIEQLMQDFRRIEALPEAEREAAMKNYRKTHPRYLTQRLFVGKNPQGHALLLMRDGAGNIRLRLRVADDGTTAIEFLDGEGNVTGTVTPETLRQ